MVRFKNRWLLLSVEFPDNAEPSMPHVTPQALITAIRSSLSAHFGQEASGALGGPLSVKYASSRTRLAILRCSRVGADVIRAAVTLICDIDATVAATSALREASGKSTTQRVLPTRLSVIGISGTIKKLQLQAIRMDRRIVQEQQMKSKRLKKAANRRRRDRKTQDGAGRELPIKVPELVPPASAGPQSTLGGFDDAEEDLGSAL
ncbi:unnamed protein product [Parajaminaea phylloscopi]